MPTPPLPSRDLVLIGAGHTHLHVARMWRMQPIPETRLTLVSPYSRATYSGMLPGLLAGLYQPDELEIDLYRLSESCGFRLLVDGMTGLDPAQRQILFRDRPPIPFDIASIGIGSVPGQRDLWSQHPEIVGIKPLATFHTRLSRPLRRALHSRTTKTTVAVVGAGAGGFEVSLALQQWLSVEFPGRVQLVLVHANAEILTGYSTSTIRRARRELERRGILLRPGSPVTDYTGGRLIFAAGEPLQADIVVWATSAAAPPVLDQIPLPKAADGFLAARSTLQTTAEFPIFAVGDTATIVEHPVAKAGVYAVREGPILWDNLQRMSRGEDLVPYRPQRGFLSLLSLGDRRALLEYHGFSAGGRWAWKLKDSIDRKFVRMYQAVSPRAAEMPGSGPAEMSRTAAMRCAGCGGKVGARVLSTALARLNIAPDSRTIKGLDRPDDAVVLNCQATPVELLSVDFFEAFLDDPYLLGRIAAVHALSDLWAMGGDPLGALAIVSLPRGPARQQTELLYQLLAGAQRELSGHGAALWGGHTIEASELTIGFTVAGTLGGRPPLGKDGLAPGDQLILTKPLGTATLLVGLRQGLARAPWIDRMLQVMLQRNAVPARLARKRGVVAATDITGFGLAGHLFEMLEASRLSARLSLSAIPLLDGFAELCGQGIRSSLDTANREIESRIQTGGNGSPPAGPAYDALFDPQTSGGLLLATPPAQAAVLLEELQAAGFPGAAVIGEVLPIGEDSAPGLQIL